GATPIGSSPVGKDGSWGVLPSMLAPGLHTLTAIESDTAGNTSPASAPLTLKIDVAAPAGLTLAPGSDTGVKGDNITSLATPIITGTGGTPGDGVFLYDGLTPIGSSPVGKDGSWGV